MSNTVQTIQASPTNAFGLMATPAVDLTPTGHLPYLVGQPDTAREHPETTAAEPNTSPLAGLSIVAALVNGVQVPVACPAGWCIENHTGENTGHLKDVNHTGATVDLYAPTFRGGFDELFAYAHLVQDPYSKNPKERSAYIRVEDGGGEESPLTPDQADTFADNLTVFAGRIRTLARVARAIDEPAPEPGSATTLAACPDGITWCLGDPRNHHDGDEHRHESPERGLGGSYLQGSWDKSLVGFQIAQWSDGEPHLVFQSDGTWPDLDLPQVDELIGDAVPWLVQLIATRRRIAIELKPSRTPFTESEDAQTASAAFDLASRAMGVALEKSEDRATTLRALRSFLDMAEAEQA